MKRLIAVLMITILLAGCSGKKNEMKPAEPIPGLPSAKPADSDPYEIFYGTWRTSGIYVNESEFNIDQLKALGAQEKDYDMIVVFGEDGFFAGYVANSGATGTGTWKAEENNKIFVADNLEFFLEEERIYYGTEDQKLYLSRISDRQDAEIITELTGKAVISSDSQQSEEMTEPEPEPVPEEKEETVTQNTIRPEVKEAIDAYEAFIDEYCEFMVKYSESDGTDLKIIADYAVFLGKLTDYEYKMDKMADDLTDAEYWYYVEVLNRCNEKIMKAAS